ncbi:PIN domain-containing protein [Pseudonocardia sp. DSM 110487]|uniref:PIN domain-containing protein n=1 Tax=Pseudonocardia sp. DSM 110487 TaxID=2865833 RepID=UPI001C6A51FF|nr:PIN domain-containing protein [Pseudonocardia sp. DSM 110487]QYN37973.1 PIN domain-containing protein [Pseudonocardia sp. DSM 110487]
MTAYCFDTDIISATIKPTPPLHLIRRLATVPAADQFTTSITVAELVYGARRLGRDALTARVEAVVRGAQAVLPFDTTAARRFGELKAELERCGERLAEPDLRIAAIVVSRELTLVTRNVRHFRRVPGLVVENWIDD